MRLGTTGLIERLLSASVGLLVAALLLVLAIRLIESVLVPMLVIGAVMAAGFGLFLVCRLVRRRRAGW